MSDNEEYQPAAAYNSEPESEEEDVPQAKKTKKTVQTWTYVRTFASAVEAEAWITAEGIWAKFRVMHAQYLINLYISCILLRIMPSRTETPSSSIDATACNNVGPEGYCHSRGHR